MCHIINQSKQKPQIEERLKQVAKIRRHKLVRTDNADSGNPNDELSSGWAGCCIKKLNGRFGRELQEK